MDKELIRRSLMEASKGGRIACSAALKLAKKLRVPPKEIGRAANQLGITISSCQLGCF